MSTPPDNQPKEADMEPQGTSADPDPGPPIPELAELALPTSSEFEARVYRRIKRRLAAAEVVKTPVKVTASMIQTYVNDLVQAIHTLGHRDGKPPDKPDRQ